MSNKVITTGISQVTIKGDTVIKELNCDCEWNLNRSFTYEYATRELFIMNLLNRMPTDVRTINGNTVVITMGYLGRPIEYTSNPNDIICRTLYQLAILHDNHIIHCDLKPDNILIDTNGNVSIIDFTHSTIAGQFQNEFKSGNIDGTKPWINAHKTTECTRMFTSPESYDEKATVSYSHDIWSLGCTFYEVITGGNLFPCVVGRKSLDHIKELHKQPFQDELKRNVSDEHLLNMLTRMLAYNPEERPTVYDLLQYMGVDYHTPISFNCESYQQLVKNYCPKVGKDYHYPFHCMTKFYVDNLLGHIMTSDNKPNELLIDDVPYLVDIVMKCLCAEEFDYDVIEHKKLLRLSHYVSQLWILLKNYRMITIFGSIIDNH